MILLYRILYLPGLLLALPYYLYRMWRRGGYGSGFFHRFGIMTSVPRKRTNVRRIWIQAVSVGELLAIEPILRDLAAERSVEVVLTTTTSTGYRLLRERLRPYSAWSGVYPLDFWPCSAAAWRAIQPDLAVLMEGELWPEHIHQAYRRKVPVVLINARLSDRSFGRHVRLRRLGKKFYHKLSGIYAGGESDVERFKRLAWIPEEKVQLTGNLKLDLEMETRGNSAWRVKMLEELGFGAEGNCLVLLGSSTWPGEERILVDVYERLLPAHPSLRLLLVPRHAERRKAFLGELENSASRFHFRSDSRQAPEGTGIYIADTTGELRMLTQLADIVFIGKSLPPNKGGQTPIEAAALGKPLIFGPDMSNFRDISRRLVREKAAIQIREESALFEVVRDLLEDPGKRLKMAQQAKSLISASRGATARTLAVMLEHLESPGGGSFPH